MKLAKFFLRVCSLTLTLALLVGMMSVMGAFPMAATAETETAKKFVADFSELGKLLEGATMKDSLDNTHYETACTPLGDTETLDGKINTWMREHFASTTNHAYSSTRAWFAQKSDEISDAEANGWGKNGILTGFALTTSGYLRLRVVNSSGANMMRRVDTIIPQFSGENVKLKNFKMTIKYRNYLQNYRGAIMVGLDETKAGYIPALPNTYGELGYRRTATGSTLVLGNGTGMEQAAGNDGWIFYNKKSIISATTVDEKHYNNASIAWRELKPGQDYTMEKGEVVYERFETASTQQLYTLTVEVKNGKATFTTVSEDGTRNETMEMDYTPNGGYVSIGMSNRDYVISYVDIEEYDDDGNAVDFGTYHNSLKGIDKAVEVFEADFTDLPDVNYVDNQYLYNTNHDTATGKGVGLTTIGTKTVSSVGAYASKYTVNVKDKALVGYLESKFDFYTYANGGGGTFPMWNAAGYIVDAEGNPLGSGFANSDSHNPATGVGGGGYMPGSGKGGYSSAAMYPTLSLSGNKWLHIANDLSNAGIDPFAVVYSYALKNTDGSKAALKNFQLDLDFILTSPGEAAYPQNQSPVFVKFGGYDSVTSGCTDGAMFAISHNGGYFLDDLNTPVNGATFTATKNSNRSPAYTTYIGGAAATQTVGEAHLTLTVKNGLVNAVVTLADGTEVLNVTKSDIHIQYGNIFIGTTYAGMVHGLPYFGAVRVTRLDNEGNPIDFHGEDGAFTSSFVGLTEVVDGQYYGNNGNKNNAILTGKSTPWLFNATPVTKDYAFGAEDKALVNILNERFDFYHLAHDGKMYAMETPYQNGEELLHDKFQTNPGVRWVLQGGKWLKASFSASNTFGELFRKQMALVPKVNGEAMKLSDFAASFDVQQSSAGNGAVTFTFRSAEPAKMRTYTDQYDKATTLVFTRGGMTIYDGESVDYRLDAVENNANRITWANNAIADEVHVELEVLGSKMNVKVTSLDGATVYYEGINRELVHSDDPGYVYFNVANNSGALADIDITPISSDELDVVDKMLRSITFNSIKGENTSIGDVCKDLALTATVTLPTDGSEVALQWESSDISVITHDGKLVYNGVNTSNVTMTASFEYEGEVYSRDITITVAARDANGKVLFLENDLNPYTGVLGEFGSLKDRTFDSTLNSIGYDLGAVQKVNRVVLSDGDGLSRLHKEHLALYVSDDNVTYERIKTWDLFKVGNDLVLANFETEARFVKVHCHLEDAEEMSFTGRQQTLITANYTNALVGNGGGSFEKVCTITSKSATGDVTDAVTFVPYGDLDKVKVSFNADWSDIRFVLDGNVLHHYDNGSGFFVRLPETVTGKTVSLEVYGNNPDAVNIGNDILGVFEAVYGNKTIQTSLVPGIANRDIRVAQLANGDIICSGAYEISSSGIYIRRSTDGGRTFSDYELAIGKINPTDTTYPYCCGFVVDGDTVFMLLGRAVAYHQNNMAASWARLYISRSDDFGRSWTQPQEVTTRYNYNVSSSSGIALSTADGAGDGVDYLFPFATQINDTGSFAAGVVYSKDGGNTWVDSEDLLLYEVPGGGHETGTSEGTLAEMADGSLRYVVRCQGDDIDKLAVSYSYDKGLSWTAPVLTDISAPNTMPFLSKHNGNHLLLWGGNNALGGNSYKRWPLSIAYSDDEMQTWKQKLNLYNRTSLAEVLNYNLGNRVQEAHLAPSNYKGNDDYIATWDNKWQENKTMLLEDFGDMMYKTKGAANDFETTTAKYAGWLPAEADGTCGLVQVSTDMAKTGNRSLKLQNVNGNLFRGDRSVPALAKGEVVFDVYFGEANTSFILELKSALTDVHYKLSAVALFIAPDGTVTAKDTGNNNAETVVGNIGTLTNGEWKNIRLQFDIANETAVLYVDGVKIGDVVVNSEAGDTITNIQLSAETGDVAMTAYVDNFYAYEGVSLMADMDTHWTVRVEGMQEDNTAVVNQETGVITVKAAEGYQLKAGSLLVKDANGNYFVPERVGFRNGGDASQYKVPENAVAPYTVEADFYQPTIEDINMGLVGYSYTDAQGGGLRFVHRLNVTEKNGKLYMMVDGENVEVKEYGLLLAAQTIVKDPQRLTIKVADESMHVQRYVWPTVNRYFDKCEEYVDVAVHVIGIETAGGANINLITRTYVELADGTVVYGTPAVDNYNAVRGM